MNLYRRDFLAMATAATAGCLLSANTSVSATSKTLVTCRDAHLTTFDPTDSFQAMKQVGVDGVEVWVNDDRTCPYLFHPDKSYSIKTAKAIETLAKDFETHGMKITAFALPNKFDERPDFEFKWMKDTIEAAKAIGVKAIRIDVVPRKIRERKAFIQFAADMGNRLVELVEETHIGLGIENHGSTTNDPAFLNALFARVPSNKLGLTLDTANFYWFGHPLDSLYGIYEKYADRVHHTHCKSIDYPSDKENIKRPRGWEYGKYNCPIYKGDIDFQKVLDLLKKSGYSHDYCIENESLGKFPKSERSTVLKKEAQHLRELL